tara:strand:+ start:429 stop:653 length:225 start_codon:yes stop_codon:yes gene_type:complete
MQKENCWVWFKGALQEGGHWKGGFTCKKDEYPGVLIESPSYVSCRVPEWRISTKEPDSKNKAPNIPEKAIWKII